MAVEGWEVSYTHKQAFSTIQNLDILSRTLIHLSQSLQKEGQIHILITVAHLDFLSESLAIVLYKTSMPNQLHPVRKPEPKSSWSNIFHP